MHSEPFQYNIIYYNNILLLEYSGFFLFHPKKKKLLLMAEPFHLNRDILSDFNLQTDMVHYCGILTSVGRYDRKGMSIFSH